MKRTESSDLVTQYWLKPSIGNKILSIKNWKLFDFYFRTINTKTAGGESSILKRFQKEITGKVADVVRGILNRSDFIQSKRLRVENSHYNIFSALSSVDSKYFF